jgi:hypothetical protein
MGHPVLRSFQVIRLLSLILALPIIVEGAPAPGDAPADRPAERPAGADEAKISGTAFDALIGRIREAAVSGDWKREGWKDPAIDTALTKVVDEARKATNDQDLALPVALADVRAGAGAGAGAGAAGPGPGRVEKALVVGQGNVAVGFASSSVILADGNARVSFATNCVIVARGAVYIAHGSGNVVVAGHYIHVSHDGNRMGRDAASPPSVLVSGGVVDVSHAKQTVCSAPHLVQVSHADGVRFVNSPKVQTGHERGQNCPRINGVEFGSAPEAKRNPLTGKINVLQVVRGNDAGKGAMVVLEKDGVEWVVRPGAKVLDAAGKPIAGLEGWAVSFIGEDFALFSSDREDAGFLMPKR